VRYERGYPLFPNVAVLSFSLAALLVTTPSSSQAVQAAQDNPPCPFTNDSVVSPALGSPVHGYADQGTGPGFDVCEFGDFTIYRQSGADVVRNLGLAGLAQNVVLGLPGEMAAQIGALGLGRSIDLPGYQIATLDGLGDAALWVKNVSFGVDALAVQHGNEVFVFQVLDRSDAQAISTAVARAVVANAPVADTSATPAGVRPAVVAECGLDAANAVADRLQRADVTAINVIGGCHFVDILTTLGGNGIANATTAREMCDSASEVAYTSGILGITVTDTAGHERAAGQNREPCIGVP
jgi:hypothetical protein